MERWGEDGYKRKVRNKTKEKEAERKKKSDKRGVGKEAI